MHLQTVSDTRWPFARPGALLTISLLVSVFADPDAAGGIAHRVEATLRHLGDPQWSLVVAAVAAGALAAIDIRRRDGHHERQLAASLRPFVVLDRLSFGVTELLAPVVNVGVGPAISVQGKGWVFEVPQVDEANLDDARKIIAEAEGAVRSEPAHYELSLSALGVDRTEREWVQLATAPALTVGRRAAFAYELTYDDVFENHYKTTSTQGERVYISVPAD